MNEKQLKVLKMRGTDVENAIKNLCKNEQLYESCMIAFLDDKCVEQLNIAIENDSWDEAFTAAHALKGVAGNLGFIPLMHSTAQLIVLIRGGKIKDAKEFLENVNSAYRDIIDGIHLYSQYAKKINN